MIEKLNTQCNIDILKTMLDAFKSDPATQQQLIKTCKNLRLVEQVLTEYQFTENQLLNIFNQCNLTAAVYIILIKKLKDKFNIERLNLILKAINDEPEIQKQLIEACPKQKQIEIAKTFTGGSEEINLFMIDLLKNEYPQHRIIQLIESCPNHAKKVKLFEKITLDLQIIVAQKFDHQKDLKFTKYMIEKLGDNYPRRQNTHPSYKSYLKSLENTKKKC